MITLQRLTRFTSISLFFIIGLTSPYTSPPISSALPIPPYSPFLPATQPEIFLNALESRLGIIEQREYLAEYKRYVEQTVVHDRDSHLLIGIMRDITDEEYARERKEQISRHTVEVADKVVEKQMRIVQEIASLLGETAAETKIALAKLKESITDE